MNHKTYISLTLGAAFSFFGLYLAFRNVPVASLLEYAAQIDYGWTIPAAISLMLAYLVRSVRWQWLLMPAGRLRLASAYHSIIISMMANCLLPGRMGELVRPIVLKRLEALPFTSSLATLGVERLLDLATLLVLLLPTLVLVGPQADNTVTFGRYQLNRHLLTNLGLLSLMTSFILLIFIYAIGSARFRTIVIAWLHHLPSLANWMGLLKLKKVLQHGIGHLSGALEMGAHGVMAINNLKGFLVAMATSFIFWGFNALSFYFLSLGSPGIELSLTEICGVMVVICFFIALPSVPGFWGLWEAAGVLALSFFGIAGDAAAGYSLFSHAFAIFPPIVAGWISCLLLGFRWKTFTNREPSQAG